MATLGERLFAVALSGVVSDDDPSVIADAQGEIERLTALLAVREALSSPAPVAWRVRHRDSRLAGFTDDAKHVEELRQIGNWNIEPLYDSPSPVLVGEVGGWKLVRVPPTQRMIDAGVIGPEGAAGAHVVLPDYDARGRFIAMCAASPSPAPTQAPEIPMKIYSQEEGVQMRLAEIGPPLHGMKVVPKLADPIMLRAALGWREADSREGLSGEEDMFERAYYRMVAVAPTIDISARLEAAESALAGERERANWLHGIVEESAPHRLTEDKPKETRE